MTNDEITMKKICYKRGDKMTLEKTFQKIFRQNKRLGVKLIYHDRRRQIQFFRLAIENAAKIFVKICKKVAECLFNFKTHTEGKNDSKGILTSSN